MNSLTDETMPTVFPLIIPILEQQALLQSQTIREGYKFWWYRLDDAKFIYLLTQHAQWSRTLKPFLLCGCNKGEEIGNDNHICSIVSDNYQLKLYIKSNKQLEKKKFNAAYDKDSHQVWVSKYNRGVSHVGIHPTFLPRCNIRCDVFHISCAIGNRLLSYLQGFAFR